MVLSFVGNLLGGLIGSFSARSSHQRDLELMSQQFAYDKALANEQYNYASRLNVGNYQLSRDLTRYNYQLQRESRQSSFYDTRKDLESAGYNPLLALGVQSNSLNPGMSVSGSGFSMPDSSSVFGALSTLGNLEQIKSNIDSSKYVNDLNIASAEKVRSETRGQDINNVIQDRYGLSKALQEIEQLKSQGLLNKSQAKYYRKQLAIADSQIAVNSAEAQVLRSQKVLNQQQFDINEPTQRFAKKHPVAHGTLQRVNPVSALGSLAGLKYMLKK